MDAVIDTSAEGLAAALRGAYDLGHAEAKRRPANRGRPRSWCVELALWPFDSGDEAPAVRLFGPMTEETAHREAAEWRAQTTAVVAAFNAKQVFDFTLTVTPKRLHRRADFDAELGALIGLYETPTA